MSDEREIIECFALFDDDKSGKVNSRELVQALTTLGEMSTDEAEQLIADAGGKSNFDYAKFVKKMNKKARGE